MLLGFPSTLYAIFISFENSTYLLGPIKLSDWLKFQISYTTFMCFLSNGNPKWQPLQDNVEFSNEMKIAYNVDGNPSNISVKFGLVVSEKKIEI
jgi:hypothetical protein